MAELVNEVRMQRQSLSRTMGQRQGSSPTRRAQLAQVRRLRVPVTLLVVGKLAKLPHT